MCELLGEIEEETRHLGPFAVGANQTLALVFPEAVACEQAGDLRRSATRFLREPPVESRHRRSVSLSIACGLARVGR